MCQSHTGRLTGLWFLPKPAFGLNTNDDDYGCFCSLSYPASKQHTPYYVMCGQYIFTLTHKRHCFRWGGGELRISKNICLLNREICSDRPNSALHMHMCGISRLPRIDDKFIAVIQLMVTTFSVHTLHWSYGLVLTCCYSLPDTRTFQLNLMAIDGSQSLIKWVSVRI